MDFVTKYAVDLNLESEGAWVDMGDGLEVKLARWGNQEFYKALEAESKKTKPGKTIDADADRANLDRVISTHIIKDWRGLNEAGKAVKYSPEKAFEILQTENLKDFRLEIIEEANERERYRLDRIEDSAKN